MIRRACACLLLAACAGSQSAAQTTAMSLSECGFSGTLQGTSSKGLPVAATTTGTCRAAVYGAEGSAGVDLLLDLGRGEGLHVTFALATRGQGLQLTAPPGTVDDQSVYLGASVPVGVVWARHRKTTTSGGGSDAFVPLQGSVTLDAVELARSTCTDDYCSKGTLGVTLTFDDARWDNAGDTIHYNGQAVVVASSESSTGGAGGAPGGTSGECASSADCAAGEACNQPQFSQDGPTRCGGTMPTGAEIGEGCLYDAACKSNLCTLPGQCSVVCRVDGDCENGTVCAVPAAGAGYPGECLTPCKSSRDCAKLPNGAVCVPLRSPDETTMMGACAAPVGYGFGHALEADVGCDSRVPLTITGTGDFCTKLCQTSAECAAPFPKCMARDLSFKQPTKGGHVIGTFEICD